MSEALDRVIALKALIKAAVPTALVTGFDQDAARPELIPAGGMIVGLEDDPGDPAIDLSPPAYNYEHRFPIEVAAAQGAGGVPLDAMLMSIGAAVKANRTREGLWDWLEATKPPRSSASERDAVINYADLAIVMTYATSDPLA